MLFSFPHLGCVLKITFLMDLTGIILQGSSARSSCFTFICLRPASAPQGTEKQDSLADGQSQGQAWRPYKPQETESIAESPSPTEAAVAENSSEQDSSLQAKPTC